MSGSTAGGIIGAAIGFVASGFNPAGARWGFFVGPALGGRIDVKPPESPLRAKEHHEPVEHCCW